jgi:DNA-binding FadR family transcriptional regulator
MRAETVEKMLSPAGRFQPIRTRRIFEEICHKIRQQIMSGELQPGDRLPPERELSEMFAVSRTAVREALRSLEIAGLVELRKGSKGGAFILDSSVGLVAQSIQDMLDFGRASLANLLEARLMIQDIVVPIACKRATATDIAALEANIDETEALTRAGRFEERTFKAVEFNTILARATGNYLLAAIVEAISEILRAFFAVAGPPPHDPLIASRREFIAHLKARRPAEAARSMRSYLEQVHDHLIRFEARRARTSGQQRIVDDRPKAAKQTTYQAASGSGAARGNARANQPKRRDQATGRAAKRGPSE